MPTCRAACEGGHASRGSFDTLYSLQVLHNVLWTSDLSFPSNGVVGCAIEVTSGKRGTFFVSSAVGRLMAAPRLPAVCFVSMRVAKLGGSS